MQKNWKSNIYRFIFGQSVSLFGSSLVQYAITWHLTLETKSGVILTVAILAGFLPSFFLSPLAGVWVDRYNRKLLIALSDGMIALVTLITAIALLLGYDSITLLLLISIVRSLGNSVHSPTVAAMIPDLVPKDKLMEIQGLQSSIQSAIFIISPILSAALMATFPLEVIFSIDVITAILGISLLLFWVKVPPMDVKEDHLHPWIELKNGITYISKHSFLIPFFLFSGVVMFLIAPVAFLSMLQTIFKFGDEPWRLSAIEVAFGSGMMIGGFVISKYEGFKNRIKTMVVSLLIMGIVSVALSFATHFNVYLASMFIFGITLPYYNAPATVLLQEKVEPEYMGRIFSVFGMISSSVMPLSMVIFGPLADAWQVDGIMIGAGIVMMTFALILLINGKLIQHGD